MCTHTYVRSPVQNIILAYFLINSSFKHETCLVTACACTYVYLTCTTYVRMYTYMSTLYPFDPPTYQPPAHQDTSTYVCPVHAISTIHTNAILTATLLLPPPVEEDRFIGWFGDSLHVGFQGLRPGAIPRAWRPEPVKKHSQGLQI